MIRDLDAMCYWILSISLTGTSYGDCMSFLIFPSTDRHEIIEAIGWQWLERVGYTDGKFKVVSVFCIYFLMLLCMAIWHRTILKNLERNDKDNSSYGLDAINSAKFHRNFHWMHQGETALGTESIVCVLVANHSNL